MPPAAACKLDNDRPGDRAQQEPDENALLQWPQDYPRQTRVRAGTADAEESTFVQLVFNHSDPEPDLDDERHALNVEIEATPSSVVDILESTLAVLWERGDEMLAQNLAMYFVQLSSQSLPCDPAHHFLQRVYRATQGYALRGRAPIYLVPAWQSWADATVHLSLPAACEMDPQQMAGQAACL